MTVKTWKAKPPGPEQKYLNDLFAKNLISPDAKPADVKAQHKIFDPFSTAVFRGHFNKTKQAFGTSRNLKFFIFH